MQRARKIERFLSQPFFVAEAFTGRSGEYVPVEETVRWFTEIIEGKHDEVPERAFSMKGAIDQVVEDEGRGARAPSSSRGAHAGGRGLQRGGRDALDPHRGRLDRRPGQPRAADGDPSPPTAPLPERSPRWNTTPRARATSRLWTTAGARGGVLRAGASTATQQRWSGAQGRGGLAEAKTPADLASAPASRPCATSAAPRRSCASRAAIAPPASRAQPRGPRAAARRSRHTPMRISCARARGSSASGASAACPLRPSTTDSSRFRLNDLGRGSRLVSDLGISARAASHSPPAGPGARHDTSGSTGLAPAKRSGGAALTFAPRAVRRHERPSRGQGGEESRPVGAGTASVLNGAGGMNEHPRGHLGQPRGRVSG